MPRQVGSHCSTPLSPLCQNLQLLCFLWTVFTQADYVFSQEKYKIALHLSFPSRNIYLQLPVCFITNSIATVLYCSVLYLCLWAWDGSVKSAQMMGQLQLCIMEQPKLSLPKTPQWDCLTFRQILDIKPWVHDTFIYAQVRITKAPCTASEEKWDIRAQTGDRKSGRWKIKVVFPLTVGRHYSDYAAQCHIILLFPQAALGFLLKTATFTPFKRCLFVII